MSKDDQLYNSRLVQAVRKYPCLYNSNMSEYSNKKLTSVAWKHVSEEMNDPVAVCKEKWRNLRIVFSRHLQKSLNGSSGRAKYYLYEQMEFLKPFVRCRISQSFLPYTELSDENAESLDNVHETVEVKKETIEVPNVVTDKQLPSHFMEWNQVRPKPTDEHEDHDKPLDDSFDYYPNQPKKRLKYSNDLDSNDSDFGKIGQRSNPNYRLQFLQSLLPDVEEMTPVQFRKFRKIITTVIDETLDPNSRVN